MPKSPKPQKVKKSSEDKSSVKEKATKKKLSNSSKNNAETDEIIKKNLTIEDGTWECSVVLLVPETRSLHDFLQQTLVNLPENFTILTKDDVATATDKTNKSKSRKGSNTRASVRSTSKSSKKSSKSKAAKSKNKSKKEEVEETELLVESSNNDEFNNCVKVCEALKKHIIGLKNTDIANISKNIKNSTYNEPDIKMKNKVMTGRGSGDCVDNTIVLTEETIKIHEENTFNRFVILLGFYDPLLPEVLNQQNVPMKAIINVRNTNNNDIDTDFNEKLSTVTGKSKRKASGKSKKKSVDGKVNEYSVFVERIIALSSTDEFLENCKDVIFLNYTIKNLSIITKEIGLKYKSDMLGVIYKIKDTWNKYKEYTETLYVQDIPVANESLKLDDAKIYTTMVSMVPLECTSTAVVLHCILEQTVWWSDDKRSSEETDELLPTNNSTQSSKHNSTSSSKTFIKNKTPVLIHHRDEIKYNTFHLDLPEFDFEQISVDVFMKSPVYKLWNRYPPHPKPVRKWFEFQLQKLQNLSDNCVLKQDHLFPIYLHHLLMDVLIFKTNQFTNSNEDAISTAPDIKKVCEIFKSGKESEVCDTNANIFMKEIIYNCLCKVPNFSLCQNYAEVFELAPQNSVDTTQCCLKQPVYSNRLRNKSSKELPGETLLQKRERHKQEKLNKLVSFLNCSEFVSLYEDYSKLNFRETQRLEKYGFIEKLNVQTLCQSVHLASLTFSNINYDYFPVTDTILLWFNNSVKDQEKITSYTTKGNLETTLGFREFYCHKLRESTDFGDTDTNDGEVASRKSFEERGDSFVDELKADLESQPDPRSRVEDNKKQLKVEASKPKIAYNLGSLWMECTESFNNYFSIDSSSVIVKKTNSFNGKVYIVVNVNKNNTSIRYELDPDSSNHFIKMFIDVHETLNINCVLNWNIVPEESSSKRNNSEISNNFETKEGTEYKLNCILSITLPSGLFIEVIPINSPFGPFYVRQRYLGKGPNCSSIWEESYRCFFNNGMVLIFRVDGSVDILYNNGTTVKCQSLELIKLDDLYKGSKIDKNTKEDFKESVKGNLNQEESPRTKKGSKSQQKKKGKVKDDSKTSHGDVDENTNTQNKIIKGKVKKGSKIKTENKEEKISIVKETEDDKSSYEVVQHSVLSWDGEYSQYDRGNCIDKNKRCSMRTAYDVIHRELYWQRSDGMSGLQVPGHFTIKFPDGSKTTSFTIDNKELSVEIENNYVAIYHSSGDLVRVESLVSLNNNNMGVESNKGNVHITEDSDSKKHLLSADISSLDSFDTENLQNKSFVFVENGFLMEHTNYVSVDYSNEERELKLTLPGNCWVIVDESGKFSFKGDKNERINLFNDSLVFEANVLNSSTRSKSSTTFRFENISTIPVVFSQTEDSFGNIFSVDERGNTAYLPCARCDNYDQPRTSMYSARFPQNVERLFVFNRDLTGYEMIHDVEHAFTLSNPDMKTVITPVVKDEGELYSLYMQSPVYRSKCELYIMHNIEDVTPTLIKRKDLLKAHKTPDLIWFYPEISSVIKLDESCKVNTARQVLKMKAMIIGQRLKVKKNGLDIVSMFSKLLTKYMEMNEEIYQKYLNYQPKETLREEDLIECEKNRKIFLGSKSYYLTDNLPVVLTGEMPMEKEPNKDIFSIFSPTLSKVSF